MAQTYKLFIGGKWVNSTSGKTFERHNPATEQLIGYFQAGNKEDVDKAIEAAEDAFDDWSETPAQEGGRSCLISRGF